MVTKENMNLNVEWWQGYKIAEKNKLLKWIKIEKLSEYIEPENKKLKREFKLKILAIIMLFKSIQWKFETINWTLNNRKSNTELH